MSAAPACRLAKYASNVQAIHARPQWFRLSIALTRSRVPSGRIVSRGGTQREV